jgi:citrate synthase
LTAPLAPYAAVNEKNLGLSAKAGGMDSGLEGVVAARTVLSHSDGARGILWVRGHTLDELVADYGFEGAVALLWEGFAGDGLDRGQIRASLGEARAAAFARLGDWLEAASKRPLLDAVKLALASLPEYAAPAAILSELTVAVAALLRMKNGEAPTPPDPALSTAADLLRMTHGRAMPPEMAEALDAYFTAVCENGLNASAFAARIIVSTRASLASAVLGAYCAFTGPVHGGAPGPTLDMLDEAAASGDVDAWTETKLAAGERLMGFGHRVFRNGDPRAAAIGRALQQLGPDVGRLAFAADLERRVAAIMARIKPGRPPLRPNIEINAALLLDAVGFPRDAFTPVFAVARCAGWLAHAMEQQKENRMIRPVSAYVGPAPSASSSG